MASSGSGKRLIGACTDHDRITQLPGEIKNKILIKLPIKDAVRTSILSTKWRYTWALMTQIVVEDDDLVPKNKSFSSFHFVKIVNYLLLNHKGPIPKFYLSTNYHCPEAFDRWILKLKRDRITELTFVLNKVSISNYRIPSDFFSYDALQYVDLSRCSVKLPCGFEGFNLLRNFRLEKCTISAADLERLVSNSPNLGHLVLTYFKVQEDLRIFSKCLTYLTVWGDFPDVHIDAPNLTVLRIRFYGKNSPARVKCRNGFCKSLGGLVNI